MSMNNESKKTRQVEGTETFYSPRTPTPPPPQPIFNPYASNPYDVTPSLPMVKRKTFLFVTICLLVLLCIGTGTGVFVGYTIGKSQIPTSYSGQRAGTPVSTATSTSTPTNPLDTPDFVSFLTAFNNNLAAHNWNVIASHADATNFSNVNFGQSVMPRVGAPPGMKEGILKPKEARERTITLIYGCEHEAKDVSRCLFEPPVVAHQRKHGEEINHHARHLPGLFPRNDETRLLKGGTSWRSCIEAVVGSMSTSNFSSPVCSPWMKRASILRRSAASRR